MTINAVQIDTPYLTIEQYAERTGMSKRAVQTMCMENRLPVKRPRKDGEKYLINHALLTKQALEAEY